jgi:hypothetical protein
LTAGLLALAAGVGTIGVGIGTICATRNSADRQIAAAQQQTEAARELSRKVDRAYINGGWGGHDTNNRRVYANINNHGKTPGFITRVAVKVVSWEEFQRRPPYPNIPPQSDFVSYNVAPGTRGLRATHVWDFWDGSPKNIFYGRIWYNDIFRAEHYSSFALHIEGGGAVSFEDFPEYWEWT